MDKLCPPAEAGNVSPYLVGMKKQRGSRLKGDCLLLCMISRYNSSGKTNP